MRFGRARPTRLPGTLLALLLSASLIVGLSAGEGARAAAAPQTAGQAAPALTPAEARQLLSVLNDPAKRTALTTTLTNLAKAVATQPPAKPPAGLAPNGLGAELLTGADQIGAGLAAQGREFGKALRAFRYIGPWLAAISNDPARRAQISNALLRLAAVLGAAFAAAILLNRQVRRPISALARAAARRPQPPMPAEPERNEADESGAQTAPAALPQPTPQERQARMRHKRNFARMLYALKRVPFAAVHFALELVPVLGFAFVAFLFELGGFVRLGEGAVVVQSAITAFVIGGALVALIYTVFAPGRPALRLVLIRDAAAERVSFWLRLMAVIGACGFAALNVAAALGLPPYAASAAAKLLMFVEYTLLAVLILRSRADVARRLRPPPQIGSALGQLLRMAANAWWIVALFFDYAPWFIWAAQLKNGYVRLWSLTIETALVAGVARLATVALLGGLDRVFRVDPDTADRSPWFARRAERYYPMVRRCVNAAVLALTLIVLLQVWGLHAFAWFRAGALGGRAVSALIGVLAALLAGVVVWEAANAALDRHVDRLLREQGGSAARVARARTLLPILRIVLFIFIATVLALTILSAIGVNIAPLLGGAGIVGIAIGFGSQKLVQDFITGIFLLLENTMQVGDWVTLAGLSGSVEQLSIRSIRLRAADGSLHTIPFSSVSTVTNSNRGLGNAAVTVEIAPEEDADRAAAALQDIAAEMRADPAFGGGMLSELQYWGVDKVTAQAVALTGQIVCTDAARYGVQREFNRRMKQRFAQLGIRLAEPSQIVRLVPMPEPAPHKQATPRRRARGEKSRGNGDAQSPP
ncbi:MAG TPA: mechanosensitive ion channel domain-containing protein [Stellaceae bacterium]|nr:mechanosensitive ion channel domain-containing protein [Stellaceae bacterium]